MARVTTLLLIIGTASFLTGGAADLFADDLTGEGKSLRGVEAIDAFIAGLSIDKSKPEWKLTLPKPPKVEFDKNKDYYWGLETAFGSMKFKLRPDLAPMHVSNTIYLSRLGFYENLTFFRVIKGFMAQGGCPRGDGTGNPGYLFDGEISLKLKHNKVGRLSTANIGKPNTDGSQFFITFGDFSKDLDGKHTVYGTLVQGRTTLKALERRGSRDGTIKEPLLIKSAKVIVK